MRKYVRTCVPACVCVCVTVVAGVYMCFMNTVRDMLA